MNLNLRPFHFCVCLYFSANLIFLILTLLNNNMFKIEFSDFYVSTELLIKAFSYQLLGLLFIVIIYKLFSSKKIKDNYIFDDFSGFFLIFWQFLFLLFALFLGLGVVDSDKVVNPYLVRLSNLISADILYFLIAPSLKSNKLYFLNTALYLISSIARGWLGGVVISFFIYLCRVGYLKIKVKTLVISLFLFSIILLLSPFLIDLKFMIRTGDDVKFDVSNYGEKLELAIDYILGRFQHLGHTALLLDKADNYRILYDSFQILPYWLEGIPQYFLYKLMGNNEIFTYAQMMAIWDFNASSSQPWNSNTGISGWLIILQEKSVFFFLYWGALISLTFSFLLKFANRQTFNVISVLTIIFLYHGWLGSFFNLIILTFLVILIKRIRI